jgi:SNF2 family DNA or RNA helicase
MIKKGAVAEFLSRDFDSFLWMKKLTRDQIMRELKELRVRPYFKTDPWLHQLVCFYIALCHPRFLFLLDMGLGKTKILLDIATQLQREGKLTRALIAVPRLINIDSWWDDAIRHSNLEPWHCNVNSTDEKYERLVQPQGDIVFIDYAGLHLAMSRKEKFHGKNRLVKDEKKMRQLLKIYNFMGIDESHKLSNHQSLWFSIVRQITARVDYCYATTGTLFGHSPEEAWSQFFLVDRGETFGENLGLFRASFFTEKASAWRGTKYIFNKHMSPKFHRMLQHRSLRYDEDEVLDLPERVHRHQFFEMSPEQREHYLRAIEKVLNANGRLKELEAPWLRMRQICSGYLAWKDEHGEHLVYFKQNSKLDGVERLLDEMGDAKVVIAYDYTPTGAMLVERVKQMGLGYEWFYGGTKDKSASRKRFMTDPKCRVFIMNSSAGGTGNDGLQKVARYMILYESPSSPKERKQVIKRIHRPGQTQRVFIYDLSFRGTVEMGILNDIKEGNDLYDKVVNGRITRSALLGE